MGFGCPICSERLDRLPAEAAQQAGANQQDHDVNIGATPCGHLFHTYCIQKWLSGSLASSKQCPCCRKPVPSLRILPLYPNGYEESILDDSLSQGSAQCDHTSFNVTISTLRKQLAELSTKQRDVDEILAAQSLAAAEYKQKYDSERTKSDHYLIQWKMCESYKSLAKEKEKQVIDLADKLKKFSILNSMIKGLNDPIEEELGSFPPTVDSIKTLIQMKEVLKDEMQSISRKLDECKREQESTRSSKAKLQLNYEKLLKDYKELKQVYEECRSSPGFSPDRSYLNSQGVEKLIEDNQTRTPLFQATKQTKKHLKMNGFEVDNHVPLIQCFGAQAKKRNNTRTEGIPLSQTSSKSSSSTQLSYEQPANSSKTGNRQKAASQTSASSSSMDDISEGRPPTKKFAFSKKTSTATSGQFDFESSGPSREINKEVRSEVVVPVIRKVSKLIKCNVSPIPPIQPTSSRIDETINLSSDEDDEVSQMPLRGNIPGMPVTPLRRKDGKVVRASRVVVRSARIRPQGKPKPHTRV